MADHIGGCLPLGRDEHSLLGEHLSTAVCPKMRAVWWDGRRAGASCGAQTSAAVCSSLTVVGCPERGSV